MFLFGPGGSGALGEEGEGRGLGDFEVDDLAGEVFVAVEDDDVVGGGSADELTDPVGLW